MLPISIITPSRNNLVYLKWSYESVRKYAGYFHEYCIAVDFSQDGTEEWCEKISKKDKNFKYIVNDGTWFGENIGELDRMGHCRLYDKLINEVSTNDIFLILHADMRITENMIENMYTHLSPKTIVSGTRIEPSIHPKDKSKIQMDFGLEPSIFNDIEFQNYVLSLENEYSGSITNGFFAPWMAHKKDFQDIGGHDQKTFGYQSREDTDIAIRFVLADYDLIQSRDAFCYHLTMRGSRRNPSLTDVMNDSDEWKIHNKKSERNFVRKWGFFPAHDENMMPIISHKYRIIFDVTNCSLGDFNNLEPWCSEIKYGPESEGHAKLYKQQEQPNTSFNLENRVTPSNPWKSDNDIVVRFDCKELDVMSFRVIPQLASIIEDTNELGEFEYNIFKITINDLTTYEQVNRCG